MVDEALAAQLRKLPVRPGVYMFRDAAGEILYVGKAKSLRSRARSYFGRSAEDSYKLRELSRRVAAVETFVVGSEPEALLLESNLVKEHRPRFNIQLRDDKSYPYVKVTLQEPFPRLLVTRRLERDGARYFGPFTDVGTMRRALRTIRQLYTVRSCHYDLPDTAPDRPCLDYYIDRCRAPCVGYQTEADYRGMIGEILDILSGRTGKLKRSLRERMEKAARGLDFEQAADFRDALRGVDVLERRQTTVDFRGGDRDVLGIAKQGDVACCLFLHVREGRLLGRSVHFLERVREESPEAVAAAAVKAAYLGREELPPELLAPCDFPDREIVEGVLASRRGGAFSVHVPQRGRKRRLVELAVQNAELMLAERPAEGPEPPGGEVPAERAGPGWELAEALGLDEIPRTLVCFDVSTLGGRDSTGSLAWLEDGRPRKGEYRRFRIRGTPDGHTDDYAMMQEVVFRYFHRRVAEGKSLPDLVVIDGGKGQLGAAAHALESAGLSDLPLVALAKREEDVFVPGRPTPVVLPRRSQALHWLQRVRDEAHRFAVEYNRSLRRRRTLRSALSEVQGVGPAREEELLRRFGSVDVIRRLDVDDLVAVPGIGPATARRILASLSVSTAGSKRSRPRRK